MPKPFQQLRERDTEHCKLRFLFSTKSYSNKMTFGPNQIRKCGYIWESQKPVLLLQTDISVQTLDKGYYKYNSTEPVIS